MEYKVVSKFICKGKKLFVVILDGSAHVVDGKELSFIRRSYDIKYWNKV